MQDQFTDTGNHTDATDSSVLTADLPDDSTTANASDTGVLGDTNSSFANGSTNGSTSNGSTDQVQDKTRPVVEQVKETVQPMVSQAKEKTSELAGQVSQQAVSRLDQQKETAVSGLGSVAESFRSTGQALRDQDQGVVGQYASQYADAAATQVEKITDYLREHDTKQLIHEVESFARREPAIFIAGAFLLGLASARFLRASAPPAALPAPSSSLPSDVTTSTGYGSGSDFGTGHNYGTGSGGGTDASLGTPTGEGSFGSSGFAE